MYISRRILFLAVASAIASNAGATEEQSSKAEEMIVTGVKMDAPLHLETDPKKPRQPVPAHDGADFLKTIPGFSVIRKGGADGDPVFRGMAGSRLSLLVDGETILGGCGHRMDPPSAYIFPEAFDKVRVIKGPQSVRHGPGNSAGVVLFERDHTRPEDADLKVHTSILGGSFGRHDEVFDATYSTPLFSLRASGTNAESDNYKDGSGVEVHSGYHRWSGQLIGTWTPSENTTVEISTATNDGEAAYADRSMDGSKFARENYGMKFSQRDITPWLKEIEGQIYYNYVDHVMDNYSLRELTGAMAHPSAMNPDRETRGGRVSFTLTPNVSTEVVLGVDSQRNEHTNRMTMNQSNIRYQNLARITDARFTQTGLFAELDWEAAHNHRIITGVRVDDWEVKDYRSAVSTSMMATAMNPSYNSTRNETLHSVFARYETSLPSIASTLYVGIGHNERFPDYWELIAKESATTVSAFDIESEKLTQLDTGLIYTGEKLRGSVSIFYNEIDDYLLIESGYSKASTGAMPMNRNTTISRNVDARSWGVEMDAQYRLSLNWRADVTLASVRGANDTDGRTLAQLPPLQATIGLNYDNSLWSAGLLWRAIAAQDRADPGRGNIAGQDIGSTKSANVLSFNAGWTPNDRLSLTAGIDNLLDRTYAEHISKAGASIPGFDQTIRVNEPGRTLWMKAQYTF